MCNPGLDLCRNFSHHVQKCEAVLSVSRMYDQLQITRKHRSTLKDRVHAHRFFCVHYINICKVRLCRISANWSLDAVSSRFGDRPQRADKHGDLRPQRPTKARRTTERTQGAGFSNSQRTKFDKLFRKSHKGARPHTGKS